MHGVCVHTLWIVGVIGSNACSVCTHLNVWSGCTQLVDCCIIGIIGSDAMSVCTQLVDCYIIGIIGNDVQCVCTQLVDCCMDRCH